MRYKILTVIFVVLAVFVIRLSVVKDKVSDYEFVYEKVEQVSHKVYYYNNNKLVYVDIIFDNKVEVEELFNLLTNKSNTITEDYDTKLITSTQIINFEIINDIITINLTEDFLRYNEDDCFEIYSQLKNTFSNLGLQTLKIKINNEYIDFIGYINITKGIELTNI